MNLYWRSYYLYHSGAADPVLTRLVQPYLLLLQNRLPARPAFFFIRYFEDGYHIRLRLRLNDASAAAAMPWLEQAAEQYADSSGSSLTLRQATYVPETERYGNAATLRLAEHQFEASSRIVLHWLCCQAGEAACGKHLQALKLHLAFFRALSLPWTQLLAVCDAFIEGWLPRLYRQAAPVAAQRAGLLAAFETSYRTYEPTLQQTLPAYWDGLGHTTDPEWTAYLAVNSTVATGYKAAGLPEYQLNEVFGSFLHMTHNRLGIQNREEAFILYLVRKSLLLLFDYDKT